MPNTLNITKASEEIREGRLSPVDLVQACLRRIDALEERVPAWVIVDREGAEAQARHLEEELAHGRCYGPLHGIPVGIKDSMYTKGLRTSVGSKFLADFVPDCDATVVARLRRAVAIILGKTVTTEFACFDSAETRNPWNLAHTPRGSSSGSAAAVASRMCPAAFGSQTGGSISRPAGLLRDHRDQAHARTCKRLRAIPRSIRPGATAVTLRWSFPSLNQTRVYQPPFN